jgi:hemolysin III
MSALLGAKNDVIIAPIMHSDERLNTASHFVGAALALAGLVILVVRASMLGDPWKIVSFSIYGVTLTALYVFSTLYHASSGKAKAILQKIDHFAIYFLIAGTYTPFTLVTLRGAWGWSLFGTIWGLAIIGILQDILMVTKQRILSVVIYLLMGWLVVIAIRPLVRILPIAGFALMVAGGLFYTVGVIFYSLDKRIHYGHGIFHFFVLAGSICHYFTIILYVL